MPAECHGDGTRHFVAVGPLGRVSIAWSSRVGWVERVFERGPPSAAVGLARRLARPTLLDLPGYFGVSGERGRVSAPWIPHTKDSAHEGFRTRRIPHTK